MLYCLEDSISIVINKFKMREDSFVCTSPEIRQIAQRISLTVQESQDTSNVTINVYNNCIFHGIWNLF
jgi:hypothetical protein